MGRIILNLVAIAAMAVCLAIPASAAEGSIRIETDRMPVIIRQVGMQQGNGFRLMEPYGGGYLTFDDILSNELAVWLTRKDGEEIHGKTENGSVFFSGLEEGLYLVESRGQEAFSPFLISIPWDGSEWEINIAPEDAVPQTGDKIGGSIFTLAASMAGFALLGRRRKNY